MAFKLFIQSCRMRIVTINSILYYLYIVEQLTPAIIKDNTGNSYNVGLKSLHDLYPSKVRDKLNSDFKQKHWDEKQKLAVAQVARALDEFDNKNGWYPSDIDNAY